MKMSIHSDILYLNLRSLPINSAKFLAVIDPLSKAHLGDLPLLPLITFHYHAGWVNC